MSIDSDFTRLDRKQETEQAESTNDAAHIRHQVLAYYTAAALDYKAWSGGLNMHFGYWRAGLNPLNRESMLEELNAQALFRLQLAPDSRLLDLGGGTGATARAAVLRYPGLRAEVVTIVPKQIEIGMALNQQAPRGDAITMHCADYTSTGLAADSYDAICMIESACHAQGPTKSALMMEAFRLLKPGGRIIMVDAVLLREIPSVGPLASLMRRIYRRWCIDWAVPELCRLDLLPKAMTSMGYENVEFDNWSWNVAPSVAHVPLFASAFAVVEVVKAKGKLPLWRWRHIVASLLTPLLGLRRCTFAYGAVTAIKPRTR